MIEQPFVSVVLATYNRKEQLKECLDSLLSQSYPKEKYEILIVDDGSTDGTKEVLAEYERTNPGLLKWFTQENKGAAVARNLGIENAKGEIVCITDDDCVADKNWVRNLIACYGSEDVGGVGGKIVSYNPKTIVERYYDVHSSQEGLSKIALITANASYRGDILKKLGEFDVKLMGLEDIDLGIRVRRAGFNIRYAPSAIIYHRHFKTIRSLVKRKYREGLFFACLSKKYLKYFSVKFYLVKWGSKIIYKVILFPVRLISVKKKKDYAFSEFFDIIGLSSVVLGMIIGTFSVDYEGEKVADKLDFMEDESIGGLIKRFLLKQN